VLLIPDGHRLTAAHIDKLINYNRSNPISQSLLVYCWRQTDFNDSSARRLAFGRL
jgi:predicted protein tyrosine phosphatase